MRGRVFKKKKEKNKGDECKARCSNPSDIHAHFVTVSLELAKMSAVRPRVSPNESVASARTAIANPDRVHLEMLVEVFIVGKVEQ